jgi:hypothetical protein
VIGEGSIVADERFVVTVQRRQGLAPNVQTVGIVRTDRQRPIVADESLGRAPETAQRQAAMVEDRDTVRMDCKGLVVALERFVVAPLRQQGVAAIVQTFDIIVRTDHERPSSLAIASARHSRRHTPAKVTELRREQSLRKPQ